MADNSLNFLTYHAIKVGQAVRISCSDGRQELITDWSSMASFLLQPCTMGMVFNIDEFVSTISNLLPKDISTKLKEGGTIYTPDNRKLYYQPNRIFGLNYLNFFGLSRYSEEKIEDVSKLAELAHNVIKAYEELGIGEITSLSSPVAVYSQLLDKLPFPRACDLPDSAFNLVDKSCQVMTREWRQVYKLGHWNANEITDYDLIASYPSIMATLPDISDATFFESKTIPKDYSWGLLQGDITVVKDVSPFQNADGIYPKDIIKDELITTDQLWLLNKYGGSFDMKCGWFYKLPRFYRYPFKETMLSLFTARQSNNPLLSKIAKGISVGIWGYLCQRYGKPDGTWKLGGCFNPIYGLMVSSQCSVKVARFIYHNQMENSVISVIVDGVLAEKRIPLNNHGVMGSWRMNPPTPFLVASLAYQWGADKKPAGLTYNGMIELIGHNPKSAIYRDIDLNLIEYNRHFSERPRTGGELLKKKYGSSSIKISQ